MLNYTDIKKREQKILNLAHKITVETGSFYAGTLNSLSALIIYGFDIDFLVSAYDKLGGEFFSTLRRMCNWGMKPHEIEEEINSKWDSKFKLKIIEEEL